MCSKFDQVKLKKNKRIYYTSYDITIDSYVVVIIINKYIFE